MVLTKSGYQETGESLSVLKIHQKPTGKAAMSGEEEIPGEETNLASKVDRLTEQLGAVLSWIQAQPSSSARGEQIDGHESTPPRAPVTREADKIARPKDLKEDEDGEEVEASTFPFPEKLYDPSK